MGVGSGVDGVGDAVDVLQDRVVEPVRAVRRTDWDGPAADAFAVAGTGLDGPQLSAAATGSLNVASFVHHTGVNVQYMKIVVLQELVLIAGQIAHLLTMAGPTFGASLAAVSALKALGQFLAKVAVTGLNASIASLAISEGLQLGVDALGQTVQLALRTRRDWDPTLSVDAAVVGAVGGVLGPVMNLGVAGPLGMIRGSVGRGLSGIVTSASHEYVTSGLTGAVTGRGWTGTPWDVTAGATDASVAAVARARRLHGGLSEPVTSVNAASLPAPVANLSGAPAGRGVGVPGEAVVGADAPPPGVDRLAGGPGAEPSPVRLRVDAHQSQSGPAQSVSTPESQTHRVEAYEFSPDGQLRRVDGPVVDPGTGPLAAAPVVPVPHVTAPVLEGFGFSSDGQVRRVDGPVVDPGTGPFVAAPVVPAPHVTAPVLEGFGFSPDGQVRRVDGAVVDAGRSAVTVAPVVPAPHTSHTIAPGLSDRQESGPVPQRGSAAEPRTLDRIAGATRTAWGAVLQTLHLTPTRTGVDEGTPSRRSGLRPSAVELVTLSDPTEHTTTAAAAAAPSVPQSPVGTSARLAPDPAAAAGPMAEDAAATGVSDSRLGTAEESVGGNDTAAAGHSEPPTGESTAGQVQSGHPDTHPNPHDAHHAHPNGSTHRQDTQTTTAQTTVVAAPVGPVQRSWIRRHWRIPVAGFTVLVLALLVVAGVVWIPRKGNHQDSQRDPLADQDLTSFDIAVANLATWPAIRYQSSDPNGGDDFEDGIDMKVTADGAAIGRLSLDGVWYDALTVADQTYIQGMVLTEDPSGKPEDLFLKDTWILEDVSDSRSGEWRAPGGSFKTRCGGSEDLQGGDGA